MSVAEKQRQLVAKLAIIEDPQERLAALMSRARRWPAPVQLIEDDRVHGCQSRVWLTGGLDSGVCRWRMECDSPMVKGLVSLLCELYDGVAPAEVLATEPALLDELGFTQMVTPTRLNGFAAVRARIRQLAAGFAGEQA